MSTKFDQALAAGFFALAQALPDSDRSDTGSAASSGLTTTARRDGLPGGGKNRIGLANVIKTVTLGWFAAVRLGWFAAVRSARLAAVTSARLAAVRLVWLALVGLARLAEVTPRLTRRSGAPQRCFGWPAS